MKCKLIEPKTWMKNRGLDKGRKQNSWDNKEEPKSKQNFEKDKQQIDGENIANRSENWRNTHQIAADQMKLAEPYHVHKKYEQIKKWRTTIVADRKEHSRYEKERNLVAVVGVGTGAAARQKSVEQRLGRIVGVRRSWGRCE